MLLPADRQQKILEKECTNSAYQMGNRKLKSLDGDQMTPEDLFWQRYDLRRNQEQLRLEQQTLRKSLRDNACRISEQEGTLRQLKTPDYEALRNQRACLCRERSRLEEKGSSGRLDRIHHQIMVLDRQLGRESIQESCGRRLLKLKENHQRMKKRLTYVEEQLGKLEEEKKRQNRLFHAGVMNLLEGDNGFKKNASWPDPQQ